MERRAGRRRPTRREKIAAKQGSGAGDQGSGARLVAIGHKKPGQAEVIRPDFKTLSPVSREIVTDIAQRMETDPESLYNKVTT